MLETVQSKIRAAPAVSCNIPARGYIRVEGNATKPRQSRLSLQLSSLRLIISLHTGILLTELITLHVRRYKLCMRSSQYSRFVCLIKQMQMKLENYARSKECKCSYISPVVFGLKVRVHTSHLCSFSCRSNIIKKLCWTVVYFASRSPALLWSVSRWSDHGQQNLYNCISNCISVKCPLLKNTMLHYSRWQ